MTPIQVTDDPYLLPATAETVQQLPKRLRDVIRWTGLSPSELAARCLLNEAHRLTQKVASAGPR